ncbi:MAG TPA: PAS domain-containing protein [Xanthobacteraceae bacterium]|nr:PAS domain-containing protein [Xanthobacteraceae bacterium]
MKQASSRELFGYWAARRGKRAAPERGEIEPSAIRRALGDVFILEFDRRAGHPVRLAGTRVCALFGRELKSEPFLNLWDEETRAQVAQLAAVVADEVSGAVAGVKGRTDEGWPQDLELVLLPLSQRGDTHARMIGALTPFNAPFWLGVSRLGPLTLGNVRHLDPTQEMPTAARLVAGTQGPARRAVFTVYDGGRL